VQVSSISCRALREIVCDVITPKGILEAKVGNVFLIFLLLGSYLVDFVGLILDREMQALEAALP
jgi:hypothetical protein